MKISAGFPPSNPAAEVPAGGNAGDVLTKNSATDYDDSWQPPATTDPGGVDTNVQFNDVGIFGGTNDFTFNKTTKKVGIGINPPIAWFHQQTTVAKGTPGATFFQIDASNFVGVFKIDASGNFTTVGTFAAGKGSFFPTAIGSNNNATSVDSSGTGARIIGYTSTAGFSFVIQGDATNPFIVLGGFSSTATAVRLKRNGTVLEIKLGDDSAYTDLKSRTIITNPVTVATLPAASAALRGARSYVTDATAPAFGAIVVGGGAVDSPVYCDGTNWRVG